MSNSNELLKVVKAISGSEKSLEKLRASFIEQKQRILTIRELPQDAQKAKLIGLLNECSNERRAAIRNGSHSLDDPAWAIPAARESWMFGLIENDLTEIEKINLIVDEIIDGKKPDVPNKIDKAAWIVILGTILAYSFVNGWLALLIFIVGVIAIGWKNRFD